MTKTSHTAEVFFATAFSFYLAMERIHTHPDAGTDNVSLPFYFLGSFCLEISLKAVLLANGCNDHDLKNVAKHSLAKAFELAQHKGYKPENKEHLLDAIRLLGPLHENYTLRYLPNDCESISFPAEEELLHVLDTHLCSIQQQFGCLKAIKPTALAPPPLR